MEKKIPTYRVVIDPNDEKTGVYAVSLVDEPAIEVDWIKLSKIIEMEFSVNKDKQMLYGPLLIPGKLIFRRDEMGNEYNIVFDEETIQMIADKYNENKINDVFNFQHSDKQVEAVLLQNWLTGTPDKSEEYGFSLPRNTWFGAVKVKDEGFWLNEVKTDKVKGFSVEIMAGTELIEMTAEAEIKKIEFMEIKTKDGLTLEIAKLEINEDVFEINADGSKTPLADGDYTLEDGSAISVMGGKLAEVSNAAEEATDATEKMTEEGDLAVDPNAPVAGADMNQAMDELRQVIADLSARVDALENVETVEEQANPAETAQMSKIAELEDKIEMLSKIAGAPSITVKSDNEVKREVKENFILNRINQLKNK